MIDLRKLLAKILDHPMIIESGTDSDWYWRKWSDGTAECWGSFHGDTAISAAWGNYYEGLLGNYTYPTNLFYAQPCVITTFKQYSYAGWIEMGSEPSASQTGKIYIMRPTTSSTASYGVSIYAIGRWKA